MFRYSKYLISCNKTCQYFDTKFVNVYFDNKRNAKQYDTQIPRVKTMFKYL